jgi:hypothetical protein
MQEISLDFESKNTILPKIKDGLDKAGQYAADFEQKSLFLTGR